MELLKGHSRGSTLPVGRNRDSKASIPWECVCRAVFHSRKGSPVPGFFFRGVESEKRYVVPCVRPCLGSKKRPWD